MYTFVIENVHFFEILRVYVFIAKIITFMINGAFRNKNNHRAAAEVHIRVQFVFQECSNRS